MEKKVAWLYHQIGIMDFVWRDSNLGVYRKQGRRAARGTQLPSNKVWENMCPWVQTNLSTLTLLKQTFC